VQKSLRETTDSTPALSTIDVGERVIEISELHRERVEGREVAYHFERPKVPVQVQMDSDALDQIFRNLLANAHDACAEEGEVFVRLQQEAERVVLEVRDTGVGMSEDTLQYALQPFFSTRTHGAGHGLGLPIVQRLCRDFDIAFEISSSEGEGTTVVLTFGPDR